jgi:predicted SAM-dependent methyltransferase
LTECIRILKPGGVIRVVVPDMYRITDEYVSTMRRLDAAELADSNTTVYLSARIGVDEVSEAFAAQFYEITAERQRLFGHRWMYDKWSLRRALERAGFTEVTEMHYRHGSLPDLDELDCRPANSLHMEARKAENGTGRASTHANTHTTLLPVATIPKEH